MVTGWRGLRVAAVRLWTARPGLADLLFLAGLVVTLYGVALIYPPLAWLLGGCTLLLAALRQATIDARRKGR